jgi:hypothetical protein
MKSTEVCFSFFKCEKGGHLEFECPYLKIESDETENPMK